MANVKQVEIFDCKPEELYNVLTDYEKYPEFLEEVRNCRRVSQEGSSPIVEYEVSIIKSFRYKLKMTEVKPTKVSWSFTEGDLFKMNNGSWELQPHGENQTRVQYAIEAKFNMFVPGMIEKKLIEVNIPKMMDAYKKRVQSLRK